MSFSTVHTHCALTLPTEAIRGGYSCNDLNGWYSDGLLFSADMLVVAACAGLALALLTCVSLCSRLTGWSPPAYRKLYQSQYPPGRDSVHQPLLK